MAFAFVADIGTASSSADNQASRAITTTAAAAQYSLVVVLVAVDNIQTADGNGTAVASMVDSAGNVYRRAKEYVNGNGATQTGADVSIWYSQLQTALGAGGTITATFTTASLADASAMTASNFTVAATYSAVLEGATPATEAVDAGAVGSIDVTTANIETLRVRAIATESNSATALTPTASWTIFAQAVSGAGTSDTEMGIRGEWVIYTGTNNASAPTGGDGAADHASAYVAFKEIPTEMWATQEGAEVWVQNTPSMRVTQTGAEVWMVWRRQGGVLIPGL
jgi:hypothetical protein